MSQINKSNEDKTKSETKNATNRTEKVADQGSVKVNPENSLVPLIDVYSDDNAYHFLASLPGVALENLDITINEGNELVIAGSVNSTINEDTEKVELLYAEYEQASYYRKIRLNERVNTELIEADLKNGLLHLSVPFKESQTRKIEINT